METDTESDARSASAVGRTATEICTRSQHDPRTPPTYLRCSRKADTPDRHQNEIIREPTESRLTGTSRHSQRATPWRATRDRPEIATRQRRTNVWRK
jgi:hypothetical protein